MRRTAVSATKISAPAAPAGAVNTQSATAMSNAISPHLRSRQRATAAAGCRKSPLSSTAVEAFGSQCACTARTPDAQCRGHSTRRIISHALSHLSFGGRPPLLTERNRSFPIRGTDGDIEDP
jgi:hypothetical protein